jgi:hypothetical protein
VKRTFPALSTTSGVTREADGGVLAGRFCIGGDMGFDVQGSGVPRISMSDLG